MTRRSWLIAALIAGPAAGLALAVLPAGWVEQGFSRRWFPLVAGGIARLSGAASFSIGELVLAVALPVVLGLGVFAFRSPAWSLKRAFIAIAATGSVVYAAFILLWGLNYGRQTPAENFNLEVRASGPEELRVLLDALIVETGRARREVPEDAHGVATIPGGIAGTLGNAPGWYRRAGDAYPLLAGRFCPPKVPVASVLMSWLGIGGIYNPFTAEPNVNGDMPLFTLPFAALHEMAHGQGFAVEAEANYVAILVGRDFGDPHARYASLYNGLTYVVSALMEVDRDGAERRWRNVDPGIRRDRVAVRAWRAKYDGPARAVAGAVNDAYLKSQGVEEGIRSYGLVVDLLLAERRGQSGSR